MDFIGSVCAYLEERGAVYECRDGAVFVVFKAARFALPFMFFERGGGWSAYCELPFAVPDDAQADFAAAVQACNATLGFGVFELLPARGVCAYRATAAEKDAAALVDGAYGAVAANAEKLFFG